MSKEQIIRGDTPIFNLTVISSETGSAFNLTGYTITMTTKGAAVITASSAGSSPKIVITNASSGLATITLSATDTATLGSYIYDIELKKDNYVFTALISEFEIVDDVTK